MHGSAGCDSEGIGYCDDLRKAGGPDGGSDGSRGSDSSRLSDGANRWLNRNKEVVFLFYKGMVMDKSFLGKGWSFPPEFRKEPLPAVMVTEEEDIRQSLHILLATRPGERVHRFDFGCGIYRFVQEEMTVTNRTLLRDVIFDTVLMYEPRVTLNEVTFDTERVAEGVLMIFMDYTVRRTNSRSNMVFPFYLKEGTNL